MPVRYTLRLDEVDGVDTGALLKLFLEKHDAVFSSYLMSYEKAKETGKLHYQGWVETEVKKSTWCKYVQNHFPHEGKRKACPPVKKDEYYIYVVKGGDIRYRKGVTDEEISEWKSKSFDLSDPEVVKAYKEKVRKEPKLSFNELTYSVFEVDPKMQELVLRLKSSTRVLEDEREFKNATMEVRRWLMSRYACLKKDFDCDIVGRKAIGMLTHFVGYNYIKFLDYQRPIETFRF